MGTDFQKQTVQWFPGHMAKTRRQIIEDLKSIYNNIQNPGKKQSKLPNNNIYGLVNLTQNPHKI